MQAAVRRTAKSLGHASQATQLRLRQTRRWRWRPPAQRTSSLRPLTIPSSGAARAQTNRASIVLAHSLTSNVYASGYHRRYHVRHASCSVLGPPPCRAQPPACSTVHRTCAAEVYSLHRMKQLHWVLTGSGRCPLGRAAMSSARRLAATTCPAGRSRCTWRLGCPTRSTAGLPARRSRLDPDP